MALLIFLFCDEEKRQNYHKRKVNFRFSGRENNGSEPYEGYPASLKQSLEVFAIPCQFCLPLLCLSGLGNFPISLKIFRLVFHKFLCLEFIDLTQIISASNFGRPYRCHLVKLAKDVRPALKHVKNTYGRFFLLIFWIVLNFPRKCEFSRSRNEGSAGICFVALRRSIFNKSRR